MRCWNCLRSLAPKEHQCPVCAQPRDPNPAQSGAARIRLQYLLRETGDWDFLPDEVREGLRGVYQDRLNRLDSLGTRNTEASWPESDWTSPLLLQPLGLPGASPLPERDVPPPLPTASPLSPTAVTVSLGRLVGPQAEETLPEGPLVEGRPVEGTEPGRPSAEGTPLAPTPALSPLREPEPGPPPLPPTPPLPQEESLAAKMLAEADIRWFHSLGALLVVAAVVGWLRATWDGYGRNLAGFLILISPAALHGIAHSMRKSVPLSARLLSILAGLLTVPALLAVEIFDFLPPAVSARDYWTLAFLVSGSLLAWQAHSMREKVPLFAGVLCLVMAGMSQGPLLTSALCLMVGFLLGPIKADPSDDEVAQEWKAQLQRAGFAAGLFGCFASLFMFRPEEGSLKPLLAFTGALLYLHLPTLTREAPGESSNRVTMQACVTVLGLILMRAVLDVPASGVGLYALMAAGLFLAARPEHPGGLLGLRLGSVLGLVGLALGFFTSVPIPLGQPGADPVETVMRFALALVGAGLFGYLARQPHLHSQVGTLGLSAMLATFGGWTHLFLMACTVEDGSYFVRNGQLAPLLASYGLWVALWVIGTRWLRAPEKALVVSVALPVLLSSMLACLMSAFALYPNAAVWSGPLAWLGVVALAWQHGALQPREAMGGPIAVALEQTLPRMALWAGVMSAMFSQTFPAASALIPLIGLGLLLELGPLAVYRQPGLELAWVWAPFALAEHWNDAAFPPQTGITLLLFAVGWAASGASRAISLGFSALLGLTVIIASKGAAHPALLSLPLFYALLLALPAPRQGWSRPDPAHHGLDVLLGAALFIPLELAGGSAASLAATAATPLLALALGEAARRAPLSRAINELSAPSLLVWGFLWTLNQGSRESGLLVLLASVWAYRLPDQEKGLRPADLANGLALLGLGWLAGESHLQPSLSAIALAMASSEALALVSRKWRPDASNTVFSLIMIGLANGPNTSSTALGLASLAGVMAGIRGLTSGTYPLMVGGFLLSLEVADGQLALAQAPFKLRLLPTATVLIASSLWLLTRPQRDGRGRPLGALRLGIALLALPPLLALAAVPNFGDFLWVLAVGGVCLLASPLLAAYPETSRQLKQSGGYVLGGWVVVSLGRAVMILPWQLATMVVGLILVGVGVGAEKRRKKAAAPNGGE